MFRQARLYFLLISCCAGVVYAASFLPALTNGGSDGNGITNQAEFEAAFSREYVYCRNNVDDVDCQCFAGVAGVVFSEGAPSRPRGIYPDRESLARWQAADSC